MSAWLGGYILDVVAMSGVGLLVAWRQARLISPVITHSRETTTHRVYNSAPVTMDGSSISTSTDAAEVLDLTMEVSPTNCYVADAQRESMSPQQFTATYDRAREFIREAGKSPVDVTVLETDLLTVYQA
jgi:hypothetical protein